MARTSIYLNFAGQTEEAFNFYKQVFGTEFTGIFQRMKDVPMAPGQPALTDEEKDMIMHVELPITGGTLLMGTDTLKSMGYELTFGSNISINLEPDDLDETRRLHAALSDGASDVMPLEEMFWGAYFGSLRDKYGVRWMFNCPK